MVRQAKPGNRDHHAGVSSSRGLHLQSILCIAKYFRKYFICSFSYIPVEKVPFIPRLEIKKRRF